MCFLLLRRTWQLFVAQRTMDDVMLLTIVSCTCSIPVIANKLTSVSALAVLDYSHLSICDEAVGAASLEDDERNSKWRSAMRALHGDAWRTSTLEVTAGEDVYCGSLCTVLVEEDRVDAVRRDFFFNFAIDGLPAAFVYEDE